jgi:hypothetical protein
MRKISLSAGVFLMGRSGTINIFVVVKNLCARFLVKALM